MQARWLITFICLATYCLAEEADWQKRYQAELEKPRVLELVETPLDQALEFIGSALRLNVYLDPRLKNTGSVTIRAGEKQKFSNVLTRVLEQQNLGYELRDQALVVMAKGAVGRRKFRDAAAESAVLKTALADLGADKAEQREKAEATLLQFGPGAVPDVEKIAQSSRDAEAKLRARRLLPQLKATPLESEPDDAAALLDALKAPLSLEFFDLTPKDVLEVINSALEYQKKPAVELDIVEGSNVRVTFTVKDMRTGNVLRWLARFSGGKLLVKDGRLLLSGSGAPGTSK